MTTSKKNNIPPNRFAQYEKHVATIPEIKLKGATMPYASSNGHMRTYVSSLIPKPSKK